MSYSIFVNEDRFRKLVQTDTLDRMFRRPLMQKCVFRSVSTPIKFDGNLGDSRIVTRRGTGNNVDDIDSFEPGSQPGGFSSGLEQWYVVPRPFGKSNSHHIPSNAVAFGNKILEEFYTMGEQAGRTISRRTRAMIYNAVLGGRTVNTATVSSSTSVPVKHLCGFTRARKTDGTAVRYETVSSNNPLGVWVYDTGSSAYVERNVTGYTSTEFTTGEWQEVGAGTLTLNSAVTIATSNYEIVAKNAQHVSRAGIGCALKFDDAPRGVHSLSVGDRLKISDLRAAVVRLRETSVPTFDDGFYRLLVNSHGMADLRNDPEGQALFREYPLQLPYMTGKIETIEGCIVIETEENPSSLNTSTNELKRLNVEIENASGVRIHHALVIGKDFVEEHWIPDAQLFSLDGVPSGLHKRGNFSMTPDGRVAVNVDRISAVLAPPTDPIGQTMWMSWITHLDIVCSSDGVDANSGGDPARYKRGICIQYAT